MKAVGKKLAIAVLEQEGDSFSEAVKEIAVSRTAPYSFCYVIGGDIINSLTYGSVF